MPDIAPNMLPGFVWGFVIDANDPEGVGRALIQIPGMFEPHHPEWASPLGWPGAGGIGVGSQYPTQVGASVAVLFEHGNIHAPPAFLPTIYGKLEGQSAGPSIVSEGINKDEDPNKIAVIWEDEAFQIYVTMKKESEDGVDDRRVSIVEKITGSKFEMNATDGAQNKSVSITIAANTGISLLSNGVIDIDGTVVQIQGRRVMRKPGVTTI
jgi:hypothetical protein